MQPVSRKGRAEAPAARFAGPTTSYTAHDTFFQPAGGHAKPSDLDSVPIERGFATTCPPLQAPIEASLHTNRLYLADHYVDSRDNSFPYVSSSTRTTDAQPRSPTHSTALKRELVIWASSHQQQCPAPPAATPAAPPTPRASHPVPSQTCILCSTQNRETERGVERFHA